MTLILFMQRFPLLFGMLRRIKVESCNSVEYCMMFWGVV